MLMSKQDRRRKRSHRRPGDSLEMLMAPLLALFDWLGRRLKRKKKQG